MIRWDLVNVTPEIAAKWLTKNDVNRKLREHRCAFLARAIEDGKWITTHQGIAFAKSGRLLDGQHRLRAIIMCGQSVDIWVATNVPESAFDVMDSGMPRKMHERLKSDPRRTAIATTLFRTVGPRAVPHEYEIQLMLDILDPAFGRLDTIPRSNKSSRLTKASVMAAVALRIATERTTGPRIQFMHDSITRYLAGDLAGAPKVIVSLYRQVIEGVNSASDSRNDMFCRAWYALEPRNADVAKITFKDLSTPLGEARESFRSLTERVFDEAA